MNTPELQILSIVVVVIMIAYLFIFPRVAGSNIDKIAINDMMSSVVTLLISGSIFWGSNIEFNLIVTTVNWFWFTLISYFVLETPVMLWYFKKHKVWPVSNDQE